MNRVQLAAQLRAPVLALLLVIFPGFGVAHAGGAVSGEVWDQSRFSKARLIGGRTRENGVEKVFAGVEIVLNKGWKTYWRHPGDAGGVPPSFDWSQSRNVASLEVLYPAPQRFKDFGGFTIGYKNRVLFPVRIVPKRSAEPVELKLALHYGICSSICVPVRETLSFAIPPGKAVKLPRPLKAALSAIPREQENRLGSDPMLLSHQVNLEGPKPRIVLDVDFAGYTTGGDVFVEVTGGIYLPMARARPGEKPGRFVIDLSRVADRDKLKGQTLHVTLVSKKGHCITHVKID